MHNGHVTDPKQERNKIVAAFACFLLFFVGVFLMIFIVGSREVANATSQPEGPRKSTQLRVIPDPRLSEDDPSKGNLTPEELKEAEGR